MSGRTWRCRLDEAVLGSLDIDLGSSGGGVNSSSNRTCLCCLEMRMVQWKECYFTGGDWEDDCAHVVGMQRMELLCTECGEV